MVAKHGYGAEVRQAMLKRQQWLLQQELAEQRGDRIVYRTDMDQRLRGAERRAAASRLSKELGLAISAANPFLASGFPA